MTDAQHFRAAIECAVSDVKRDYNAGVGLHFYPVQLAARAVYLAWLLGDPAPWTRDAANEMARKKQATMDEPDYNDWLERVCDPEFITIGRWGLELLKRQDQPKG